MPSQHSRLFPPSAANRWLNCPGSVLATKDLPDTTSPYAEEGTLAHELAEIKVRRAFEQISDAEYKEHHARVQAHEKYQREMEDHTDKYVDQIQEYVFSLDDPHPVVVVEQQVDISDWAEGSFGTADCLITSNEKLAVFDFKYGKGVPVNAIRNPQLMLYGLGAYNALKLLYTIDEIELHIVQPRLDSFSMYRISTGELLDWGDRVRRIAKDALKKGAGFCAGDWCRFCKIKATCRTRATSAIEAVEDFREMAETPDQLDLKTLGYLLTKGKELDAWVRDAEEYAMSQALQGRKVGDHKLVAGRGKRTWSDEDSALKALIAAGIEKSDLYKTEPYTLAQIEKKLGKKAFGDTVGKFVIKAPGKPTLVKDTDPRPEWEPESAEDDFKEV